jgi:hypothetical protein
MRACRGANDSSVRKASSSARKSPRGFERDACRLGQRDVHRTAAALLAMLRACIVHQNVTHHLRGHGEELRPVLPAYVLPVDQPEVSLVDQSGGLQDMAAPLGRQVPGGDLMQLLLEDGRQLFHCRYRSPPPQAISSCVMSGDARPALYRQKQEK